MTEDEVMQIMRNHVERQFPMVCSNCHRRFASLREYLQITRPLGSAMPYDADAGEWTPLQPLGTYAFANCPCGNTMALSSQGMALPVLWSLLAWARVETQRRQMTPQALLNDLRDKISRQVLAEPEPGSDPDPAMKGG